MSSATSNSPLGNLKHDGALFRLPCEIRDKIYRFLVTGRYLVGTHSMIDSRINSESDSESDVGEHTGPDLSVLRVSKVVGYEAAEILYSDSVFRFAIELGKESFDTKHENLFRLKRVVSMMKNVVIDVDGWSIDLAEFFQAGGQSIFANALEKVFRATIDLSGDPDIKRHTLGIRTLKCSSSLLRNTSLFNTICQGLKILDSFRVATVEVMLTRDLLWMHRYYDEFKLDPSGSARNMVRCMIHAVTEQLEPAFGPAISDFKSDAGNVRTSEDNLLCIDDTSLVGFLEFHPGEHRVKESAAEEDRLQRGVSHRLAGSKILGFSAPRHDGLHSRRRSI